MPSIKLEVDQSLTAFWFDSITRFSIGYGKLMSSLIVPIG